MLVHYLDFNARLFITRMKMMGSSVVGAHAVQEKEQALKGQSTSNSEERLLFYEEIMYLTKRKN